MPIRYTVDLGSVLFVLAMLCGLWNQHEAIKTQRQAIRDQANAVIALQAMADALHDGRICRASPR